MARHRHPHVSAQCGGDHRLLYRLYSRQRFLLLAALIGQALVLVPAAAQSTAAVVRRAQNAVVTLTVIDSTGRKLGHGSGFILPDGRIVTNAHVIEDASRVNIHGMNERYLGTLPYVSAVSEAIDIAILPAIADPPGSLSFATRVPEVGESVIVIGAPLGLSHTVSTGIVSAVRTHGGTTFVQITAAISPGSSGGPVLNASGEVIGVTVATIDEGQALNFAVIASDVIRLVSSPQARLPYPRASTEAESRTATSDRSSEPRLRTIRHGSVISDRLTAADPTLADGSHFHVFELSGNTGDSYRLTLTSSTFDAYLLLGTADAGDWLDEDDDGAGGTDAELRFTLPQSGSYLVVVTSYDGGAIGSYTLRVAGEPERPSRSSGSGWIAFGVHGSDVLTEYLPSSVRSFSTGIVEVWIRSTFATPVNDEGIPEFDTMMTLTRVDCARRQMGFVSAAWYREGRLVDSLDDTQRTIEMSSIIPGSNGDLLSNEVCR